MENKRRRYSNISSRTRSFDDFVAVKRKSFVKIVPNQENSKQSLKNTNNKAELSAKKALKKATDYEDEILLDVSSKLYKSDNSRFEIKKSLNDHVNELKTRLMWSVIALVIGGVIGYKLQNQIISFLVKPLGQDLFYTSPTGGFDFLIKICLFFGFIIAVPIIVYNIIRFIAPAVPNHVTYSVGSVMLISVILAFSGVCFAYFVSLPAALHFLNTFTNDTIQSLISAQEYFNFVMIYMAGFAALFQMPLIMYFLNKVTPLKPAKLIKNQRFVVLGSFIIAAILTPTPDPINQFLMAAPIIGLYQTSVGVVWQTNKRQKKKPKQPEQLFALAE